MMAEDRHSDDGLRCPGERFDVTVAPGGSSPYITLTVGRKQGYFLLDYGSTESSLARDTFFVDGRGFDDAVVKTFSLPTFASGRFGLSDYRLLREPPGGQLGIVGTDFLSRLNADFSFGRDQVDVILGALPCDHSLLRARGLIPVRQDGFFSRDLRAVDPSMPNVPVLPIKIGGVSAFAQIDTGYDDSVLTPSIDINNALYDKLVAGGVALRPNGTSTIATCHGIVTNAVYAASNADFSLLANGGREVAHFAGAALIRKKSNGCGGIADMASPAAQLGMSIVAGLGSIVFDMSAGLVWVPASR